MSNDRSSIEQKVRTKSAKSHLEPSMWRKSEVMMSQAPSAAFSQVVLPVAANFTVNGRPNLSPKHPECTYFW